MLWTGARFPGHWIIEPSLNALVVTAEPGSEHLPTALASLLGTSDLPHPTRAGESRGPPRTYLSSHLVDGALAKDLVYDACSPQEMWGKMGTSAFRAVVLSLSDAAPL